MSITLSNPTTRPAMVMNGLHIDQLILRVDRKTGGKSISAAGVSYGTENGTPVFSDENFNVSEDNMDLKVVLYAIGKGEVADAQDAEAKLNQAKADLMASPIDTIKLLAAFELACGLIFEIAGQNTIVGVE